LWQFIPFHKGKGVFLPLAYKSREEARKYLTEVEQKYLDKLFCVNGKKNPLIYNANPIAHHGNFTKDRTNAVKAYIEKYALEFDIESPSGEIYHSKNAAQFARDHSLDPGNLASVIQGRRSIHKGWKLPGSTPKFGIKYRFKSPSGEIFEGHNISQLCRDKGLTKVRMSKVGRGKQAKHRGWTKA